MRFEVSILPTYTTDTKTPVVTNTSVGADLLETLDVITELGVDIVGKDLRVLAINDILLSVQEPVGNLELLRVLKDLDNALQLIRVELTGTVERNAVSTRPNSFQI